MSSRFVSAGETDYNPPTSNNDWARAQRQVEAQRAPRRAAEGKQEDGKSLYEVLQNNKAAKQEAFEESARLKNQFRNLDDDEVEFLDAVLESTRAKEQAVKQDTADQLEVFRKQREAAEQALRDNTATDDTTTGIPTGVDAWTTRKRRRKERESERAPGTKLRKLSSSDDARGSPTTAVEEPEVSEPIKASSGQRHPSSPPNATPKEQHQHKQPASIAASLVAYGSDSE